MSTRVDEIEKYYNPIDQIEKISTPIFIVTTLLALTLPYAKQFQNELQIVFIIFIIIDFGLSQFLRFIIIPTAERKRRQQLLSDAFDTPLILEKTTLYYNNTYPPSITRLGANIFENSLFSKRILEKMLIKNRIITILYLVIWLIIVLNKNSDFDLRMWISQLFFSANIALYWINLEILRFRYEKVYQKLYDHFFHNIGDENEKGKAAILDSFAEYESAKSSASVKLSSKIFHDINNTVTQEWESLKQILKMQQDVTAS